MGVILGNISMDIVVGKAHSEAWGVNVYVNIPGLDMSITPGDQVPFIPGESLDVVGNPGAGSF